MILQDRMVGGDNLSYKIIVFWINPGPEIINQALVIHQHILQTSAAFPWMNYT